MKIIVIGDLHGDHAGLLAILRATGAIDAGDRRLPDTRVIQLGDLIHGGVPRAGVDDETCAMLGMRLCDTVLIGNHELPHVWPDAGFPTFGGQRPLAPSLRVLLHEAWLRGQLVPATSVGDWLLTHAGVFPGELHGYDTPTQVVAWLCRSFRHRLESGWPDALFDAVGKRRLGSDFYGGIFWLDWQELIGCAVVNPIKQIVGHTPQGDAPRFAGYVWGVDVGAALSGKVCAIVTEDDGATWVPVVVSSDESAAVLARAAAGPGEERES